MSAFKIYLLFTVVPSLGTVSAVFLLAFIGLLILSVCQLVFYEESYFYSQTSKEEFDIHNKKVIDDKLALFKMIKIFFVSAFFIGLITAFIPSEKDMAVIIGGSYLLNIQDVKDIPPNLFKKINELLSEN